MICTKPDPICDCNAPSFFKESSPIPAVSTDPHIVTIGFTDVYWANELTSTSVTYTVYWKVQTDTVWNEISGLTATSGMITTTISGSEKQILEYKIKSYLHKAKAMLNYNNIKVGDNFDMEISHHKGINNFEKVGCFLFNIVNREYAKKLLVMLPNQKHPSHFHKIKYETFIIITGNLILIDGKKKYHLSAGDTVDLKKSGWHEFTSGPSGCIFEEISTTHFNNDSYYEDEFIAKLPRDKRKTIIPNWEKAIEKGF